MSGRGLHGNATIVLSSVVALVGIAIVVRTVAAGGGAVAQGVLIGLLFCAAGAGRAWVAWRSGTLPGATDERDRPPGADGAGDAGEGRSDG